MSSKTTNYNLHKIDLNDSPPDITVLNQNFDTIDEKLKEAMESSGDITPESIGAMPLDGGVPMTGQLHTPKVFFDRSNGVYGDGGIYKANQSSNASTQIMDRGSNNKFAILALNGQTQGLSLTFGVLNADGTSETTAVHQVYHEGNMPTPTDIGAVAKTGDTMSGNLTFKKAENGEGTIFKNHSSSADYGLVIKDTDKDGDYVALSLQSANNAITFRDNSGNINNICHSGNLGTQVKNLLTGGEISMVKRIQRGVIALDSNSTSAKATITAVNTSKAVVLFGGNTHSVNNYYGSAYVKLELTNSTTVTATRSVSNSTVSVPYQVVEYY